MKSTPKDTPGTLVIPASVAAAALGRLGGLARSEAKKRAARINGKKGGRPRRAK